VAMLGCAVIYLRRIRTQTGPSDREQCVAGIGLAALASLLLVKMLLNAHVEGYGFAHAAVATVVVIAVASSVLPAWVAARGGAAGVMRAVAAACLVIVIATHLRIAGYWEGSKTHRVAAGADAFRANPRAMIVNSAVAALQNLIPADGTVAVFPEGVMLNYLARRATSVPYVNFIPPELAIFGEGRMAAALQDHPPDYVLIVTRLTREYGPTFFGQDYGERLYEWISANYTPIRTIGGNPLSERRFGVLIARRSDVGGPSR